MSSDAVSCVIIQVSTRSSIFIAALVPKLIQVKIDGVEFNRKRTNNSDLETTTTVSTGCCHFNSIYIPVLLLVTIVLAS
jgi:hypothetical protein